ncbi:5'-nucleotidase SurE-like [Melia azedarach]|uniref:5'-nucleotidase SurE-like n=2 Tax=Melia azedarach TaxID=155640 RepID=A0ACC1XD36_MELAZ|nr:5'-nucleotidase SurE-like [Melia azedarach]KAJ4708672.1 5'-nucleotidase SurE-like [Melia azedarach]
MTTSVKNNFLPPSLISNLQQVLIRRNNGVGEEEQSKSKESSNGNSSSNEAVVEKPVILVTNGEGIESPGLTLLVEALVRDSRFNVHVCAPHLDKSASGHSVTVRETLAVSSVEISGATAYEVSGTPADCVSLALSGALFSWLKPVLVISGINKGSSCGHKMFYSGAFAGAREALISGVPSLCISLNWKQDVSCETDLKDAASVCLPLIIAAVADIEKGIFPKSCLLNVDIPSCPLRNKGLKVTRQSMWRCSLSWQAVSANRHPSVGHFMSNQQSLGMRLAQLSRDASAAGAARRLNSHRKNVEIESIGVAGKFNAHQTVKKYFRLELLEKEPQNMDEDLDFRALEDGFVAITPFSLSLTMQSEFQTLVSNWISAAIDTEQ